MATIHIVNERKSENELFSLSDLSEYWVETSGSTEITTTTTTETPTTTTTTTQGPVSIGDHAFGGVVVYIAQEGDYGYVAGQQHGLISSNINVGNDPLSTAKNGQLWDCSGSEIGVGAQGTAYGTGSDNTTAILAGCATRPIAASDCVNYNGGSYNDWFFPSRDEMLEVMRQLTYLTIYDDEIYWSSSESDFELAYDSRTNITSYPNYKSYTKYVTPCRYF